MYEQINFEPKGGHGFPVTLHWRGPGWYGEQGGQNRVNSYRISGDYDEDGYSPELGMIWNRRNDGLGTAFWLNDPSDYGGYEVAQ